MNDNGVSGTWTSEDNMFSGRWINRETGEKINITNSLINENNEMILMTSIGQLTMDELSRYYIQDTDESVSEPVNDNSISSSMDKYLLPEDKDLLNRKVTKPQKEIIQEPVKNNKHNEILEKFFKDNQNISCDINLNFDFNINELKTIMKYTDVTVDDICEYIYENIINKENIKKEISYLFNDKIGN